MSRLDLANLLLLFLLVSGLALFVLSTRYSHYRRELRRGNRHAKPAWKPFWMS